MKYSSFRITIKLSSILLVSDNAVNLCDQLEPNAKSAWENTHRFCNWFELVAQIWCTGQQKPAWPESDFCVSSV